MSNFNRILQAIKDYECPVDNFLDYHKYLIDQIYTEFSTILPGIY